MTKSWLYQLILWLVLICHSSYRGVVELLSDLFDVSISVGTVHNRLEAAAVTAAKINQAQNLSGIEVGLQDEIFQADKPVLVGVDAASTYCEEPGTGMKTLGAGIYWPSLPKASSQTIRLVVVQARGTLLGRHQSFKVQLDQLLKDFPLP